tara:strand:- start:441 stop:773 length:333 start_codon:yes stop_codon:yes gene_type:complete
MKNFAVVFLAFVALIACDDSHTAEIINYDTNSTESVDEAFTDDESENVSATSDVISQDADSVWDITPSDVNNQPEEAQQSSQLPSDPTEDPDQESSYYEFPAWHIPAPPK